MGLPVNIENRVCISTVYSGTSDLTGRVQGESGGSGTEMPFIPAQLYAEQVTSTMMSLGGRSHYPSDVVRAVA